MTKDDPWCGKALTSGSAVPVDSSPQQRTMGKAAHVARIPKGAPPDAIAQTLCFAIAACTHDFYDPFQTSCSMFITPLCNLMPIIGQTIAMAATDRVSALLL